MIRHVALTEDQLRLLQFVSAREGRPIEDLVRIAVDQYLRSGQDPRKAIEEAAFGSWGEGEDGLAYQERLRREW